MGRGVRGVMNGPREGVGEKEMDREKEYREEETDREKEYGEEGTDCEKGVRIIRNE